MHLVRAYNRYRLQQWGAALDAVLGVCERGVVRGTPDAQTAYIHQQFAQWYWQAAGDVAIPVLD